MPQRVMQGGHVLEYDEADEGLAQAYVWRAQKRRNMWYATADMKVDGKWTTRYFHRLALGVPPEGLVDHRDGDGLNNRRDNLRPCTRAQNRANTVHPKPRDLPKGVYATAGGRFWAKAAGVYLGCYGTVAEAARAYDEAAPRLFGEFASLNGERVG